MAGTDNTLLALVGAGFPQRRSFGFASCERLVGAAEGMNVLAAEQQLVVPQQGQQQQQHAALAAAAPAPAVQRRYSYRVTNVEYTEFERLGVADASVDEESNTSVFPANTNVLYVGLQVRACSTASCSCRWQCCVGWCRLRRLLSAVCAPHRLGKRCLLFIPVPPSISHTARPLPSCPAPSPLAQAVERAVRASMEAGSTDAVLPGMILNLGKAVSHRDPLRGGAERSLAAGRLECTMQVSGGRRTSGLSAGGSGYEWAGWGSAAACAASRLSSKPTSAPAPAPRCPHVPSTEPGRLPGPEL